MVLQRTAASSWFDGPIIELTEHDSIIEIPFLAEHQGALDRIKELARKREDEKYEKKNRGQKYKGINNSNFRTSYKERAIMTVPGFATLLERKDIPEGLDLTWKYYCKERYVLSDDCQTTRIIPCWPCYSKTRDCENRRRAGRYAIKGV